MLRITYTIEIYFDKSNSWCKLRTAEFWPPEYHVMLHNAILIRKSSLLSLSCLLHTKTIIYASILVTVKMLENVSNRMVIKRNFR